MCATVEFHRRLNIDLPPGKSAFLWGPRQTGKTTYLTQRFPASRRYDLLESDLYFRLSKEPHRLREELLAAPPTHKEQPVIIDEVQKIPALLDEIHWLIEKRKLSFLLCGSSARKLKRSHANMLGGRAWRFELFPLTYHEVGDDFDLLKGVNRGLIPSHYLSAAPQRDLKAYVHDYLREEIQQEGLVRNLPAFSRFLDAVAFELGELVNYSNIARECAIDPKTVAEYHQILVDTFTGYFLQPFRKQKKRQIITATPKFYLFDVGVAGALAKRSILQNRGPEFGKAFEHFLLMEILAYRSYCERDFDISFWRTKEGDEVDFVLGNGKVAIEVKGTHRVSKKDIKGLKLFFNEHRPKQSILVCQESAARRFDSGLVVMPWRQFLDELWHGAFV